MFPLALTLRSLTRADLLGLMMACALLALFVVVVMVASITWAAGYWIHMAARPASGPICITT